MNWPDAEERLSPTSIAGGLALIFSLAVHIIHLRELPLVVPNDGHVSYLLSTLPGSGHLFANFDYLRTPLYPFLLRGVFDLLGESAAAVLILNAVFSFFSIVLIAQIVRILAGIAAAVMSVVILSLWPLSIVYQHTFLPESGAMFMLSLVASAMLTFVMRPQFRTCLMLALCLTVAYYFSPLFLYLAPVCSLLALLPYFSARPRASQQRFRPLILSALAIVLIPMALSYPWRHLAAASGRMNALLEHGLIDQAVLLPLDPSLGALGPQYAQALVHARERSRYYGGTELNASGLIDEDVAAIIKGLPTSFEANAGKLFARYLREEPRRYFYGVLRTLKLFLGAEPFDSENDLFTQRVLFSSDKPLILPGPPGIDEIVRSKFVTQAHASRLQHLLRTICSGTAFRQVLSVMNAFCFALLFIGFVRRDMTLCVLPALIFTFYGFHSLILLAIDRCAFPANALAIAGSVILVARSLRWIIAPVVVVEKVPPISQKERRLGSLLEMEAMEEAVDHGGKKNAHNDRQRKSAV